MPEIVKYVKSEEIIYVEGYGEVTYHHVKKTIEQGMNYNQQYQVKNVLSNHLRVKSVPEEVDVFNLGSILAHNLKDFNIALIYPIALEDHYRLFTTAANARGGNIKLFENKTDAHRWLSRCKEQELA